MAAEERVILRCTVLGTVAVYRAIRSDGDLVELEVVSAPALAAGTRFSVTRAAASRMTELVEDADPPPPGSRFSRPGRRPRSGVLPDPHVVDA